MDPSALIFIALALAWAGYLIPKALDHHEEGARTRGIDRFSSRMRILARREPRGRRRTELVTVGTPAASETPAEGPPAKPSPVSADAAVAATLRSSEPSPPATVLVPVVLTPAQLRARSRGRALAARRRRRILDLLLLANVVVAALALLEILRWPWQAAPAGAVLVWLVICRLSVRRARRPVMERRPIDVETAVNDAARAGVADAYDRQDVTEEIARIVEATAFESDAAPSTEIPAAVPGGWDLQPVVVPTYVAKDRAHRSVRTIDLDSTGVWSSGRSAADSELVRRTDAAAAQAADQQRKHA